MEKGWGNVKKLHEQIESRKRDAVYVSSRVPVARKKFRESGEVTETGMRKV